MRVIYSLTALELEGRKLESGFSTSVIFSRFVDDMSGPSDQVIKTENFNSKEGGMETRDKSEGDIQNEEDFMEDVQDTNSQSGNGGDLESSFSENEWIDVADNFEMAKTDASVLEGSSQISSAKMTEDAVGGSQQSETADGTAGGSHQISLAQAEGAVGGSQQSSQSRTTEGAVGAFFEPCSSMSGGAVGRWRQNSQEATPVFKPLFPRYLQRPNDPAEEHLQSKFIKQVTTYEGAPVAPSEVFELQWTVLQDELQDHLTSGRFPHDTVASAGIDEESYKQMQQCAQALQDQLFEGNLPACLGNLRGFRRIFSRSKDPYLRHAFRGNPLEILQNLYYGGEGILPEDRMMLDDPFHYTRNPDDMDI